MGTVARRWVLRLGLAYPLDQRDLKVYEIAGSALVTAPILVLFGSLLLGL